MTAESDLQRWPMRKDATRPRPSRAAPAQRWVTFTYTSRLFASLPSTIQTRTRWREECSRILALPAHFPPWEKSRLDSSMTASAALSPTLAIIISAIAYFDSSLDSTGNTQSQSISGMCWLSHSFPLSQSPSFPARLCSCFKVLGSEIKANPWRWL